LHKSAPEFPGVQERKEETIGDAIVDSNKF